MSGLFRRNRGPRAAADDESREAALEERPGAPAGVPGRDLPAGVDPADHLGERPTTRRRGRLRKRLRHLRRMRELLLRDLGGLVYELERSADRPPEADRLVAEKVARLQLLDSELGDLEERLDDRTGELLLREPGIGGFCQSCGELYGSDARYCSSCGTLVGRSDDAPTAPGTAAARGGAAPGTDRPAARDDEPPRSGDAPAADAGEWLPAEHEAANVEDERTPGGEAAATSEWSPAEDAPATVGDERPPAGDAPATAHSEWLPDADQRASLDEARPPAEGGPAKRRTKRRGLKAERE